jgi:competence ComEA-like helix-hairpin-helix protein
MAILKKISIEPKLPETFPLKGLGFLSERSLQGHRFYLLKGGLFMKQGTVCFARTIGIIALGLVVACSGIISVSNASAAEKKKKEKTTQTVIVDLNNASQKELEGLKGIGSVKAKKIIAARPYKSVDDLKKAGLSKKEIDAIRPFLTIGQTAAPAVAAAPAAAAQTATKTVDKAEKTASAKASKAMKLAPGQTVNLNTATKEQLEALPEIGPVKAQAIINARPFSKVEDVMKVKGIKQKTFDKIKPYITVN